MKQKKIKITATSVNHGSVQIELRFTLFNQDDNYFTEIECLTSGFSFGGQTSGYRSDLTPTANSSVNNKVVLHGKKALTLLNTEHLYLHKDGLAQNKKDRFVISFYGVDFSDLIRNDKFKIYEENGKQMIERLVYPRFKAEITMSKLSDVENIIVFDECTDPVELAKAMRSAAEYMRKGVRNG